MGMVEGAGGRVAERVVDGLRVFVHTDRRAAGRAAGRVAEEVLRSQLRTKGAARVVFAAAQSQRELLAVLRGSRDLPWARVTTFQMDEYLALPAGVASLSEFLDEELFGEVRPGTVNRMEPGGDPAEECRRYESLLREAPIDLVCLGIGESGHLAYNDPPGVRFDDDRWVRVVPIGETSRHQGVADGHFRSVEQVPFQAFTMTVPALLAARKVVGVVPGPRRHAALTRALDGPVDEACPASALRTHADCCLFVDLEAYEGAG